MRDVGDLHANVLKQRVVDNGNTRDALQVDAIERRQEGVLNVEGGSFFDAAGEAKSLKIGQSLEIKITNDRELGPAERR